MVYKLKQREYDLLLEALRRYTQFTFDKPITEAIVGLGTHAYYRPLVAAGLMRAAGGIAEARGIDAWWCLTAKGAAIVQLWLDAGYSYKHFDGFDYSWSQVPPRKLAEGETIPSIKQEVHS